MATTCGKCLCRDSNVALRDQGLILGTAAVAGAGYYAKENGYLDSILGKVDSASKEVPHHILHPEPNIVCSSCCVIGRFKLCHILICLLKHFSRPRRKLTTSLTTTKSAMPFLRSSLARRQKNMTMVSVLAWAYFWAEVPLSVFLAALQVIL